VEKAGVYKISSCRGIRCRANSRERSSLVGARAGPGKGKTKEARGGEKEAAVGEAETSAQTRR
jgi:hypothetical protein